MQIFLKICVEFILIFIGDFLKMSDSFDFSSIVANLGANPFENKEKSYVDERFYTLPKNSDGSGSAIIALLPDSNMIPIIKMLKLDTTIERNGQRRWVNMYSPKTIGLPCPFAETYYNHYNEDPESAKRFKPKEKYICNIKVIKDPAKPENEGKIFLYEMSKTIAEKISSMVSVSEEQKAMGISPKEVFNPLSGWVFNLKCYKKKENGITSYDNSEFIQLPNGRNIYSDKGDPVALRAADVQKTYSLKDMQKPEAFKSYEELTEELKKVCRGLFGIGGNSSTPVNTAPTTSTPTSDVANAPSVNVSTPAQAEQAPQPAQTPQSGSLDALLNSL